jgi:acyl-CoA reductase-like NAD-dependent aldehyde dehydrogenase
VTHEEFSRKGGQKRWENVPPAQRIDHMRRLAEKRHRERKEKLNLKTP